MITESTALRVAALQARATVIGAGRIEFYENTRPASGTGPGLDFAAKLLFLSTSIVLGKLTFTPNTTTPGSGLVLRSCTPVWARVFTSANAFAFDCDVGTDIVITPSAIQAGGLVVLDSSEIS